MSHVLIRPLEEKDALISYKWRNNPEVWKFTANRPDQIITPEIESAWILKVLNENNSKRFAIITDQKYVGNIQITNIENFTAEYHIFIGNPEYWGKGIAFDATIELFKYIQSVLHLRSIYLFVNLYHEKAIVLYKRLGFEEESHDNENIKMRKTF